LTGGTSTKSTTNSGVQPLAIFTVQERAYATLAFLAVIPHCESFKGRPLGESNPDPVCATSKQEAVLSLR